MTRKIAIDKIENKFQPGEFDRRFLNLFKQALQGMIEARRANIKLDMIEPYAELLPAVSEETLRYVVENSPPLHVYFQDGKFIMSDDYHTYSVYYTLPQEVVPCIVLGEFDKNLVENYSGPIALS